MVSPTTSIVTSYDKVNPAAEPVPVPGGHRGAPERRSFRSPDGQRLPL